MDRRKPTWVLGLLLSSALFSGALVSKAWELEAPIEITVNEHVFDGARVSNDGCLLKVRVDFAAPKEGYSSRSAVRNYHQFQARLKFSGDRVVTSPVFVNRGPGRRVYSFTQDTSDSACWAGKRLKLQDLDIVGCRGKGCKLDPFRD